MPVMRTFNQQMDFFLSDQEQALFEQHILRNNLNLGESWVNYSISPEQAQLESLRDQLRELLNGDRDRLPQNVYEQYQRIFSHALVSSSVEDLIRRLDIPVTTPASLSPSISPLAITDPIETFNNNAHSANAPEVNITAANSIRALQKRYPNVDVEKNLREIRDYFETASTHKRISAFNCLYRIERTSEVHTRTDLTAAYILALVWEGAKDSSREVLPAEVKCSDTESLQNYIALRKEALLEKMYEAQTAYPERSDPSSCFLGMINRIVMSLNHAHIDVFVATGNIGIKPVAAESAISWVKEALLQRPLQEQKQILKEWDEETEIVSQFRQPLRELIVNKLTQAYENLLSEADRQEIIDNLEYLPSPVPHLELKELVDKITLLPNVSTSMPTQELKRFMRENIFSDNEDSFQTEYEQLKQIYLRIYPDILKEKFFERQNELIAIARRRGNFFAHTQLLPNVNLKDIIEHARRNVSRSRSICSELGWLHSDGRLNEDFPEIEVIKALYDSAATVERNIPGESSRAG